MGGLSLDRIRDARVRDIELRRLLLFVFRSVVDLDVLM